MGFSIVYFCHISRSQCYIFCNLCFCDCQCSRCLGNSIVRCYVFFTFLDYSCSKCSCIGSNICSFQFINSLCCLSCYQSAGILCICFFYCISYLLILASCVRLVTCPSVSCDRDRSLCNCQFFCTFQFTSILLTSHTNFNRCTICYISCCNLCRIICPCFIRFLIFNFNTIKICFYFLS